MPTPSPTLQAARQVNSYTEHLVWRIDPEPDFAVAACGEPFTVGQWRSAEGWLTVPTADRCSPCEAMSRVLLSRALEKRRGHPGRKTDPSTAAELTAGTTGTPGPEWPPAPPATLRVGAFTYAVRVDAEAVRAWALETHGTDRYAGFSDRWTGEVAVADRFPDGRSVPLAKQQETLLHEVLHCCMAAGNWDPDVIGHIPSADREEYVVSTLSERLFTLLRDHPDLTAYLAAQ